MNRIGKSKLSLVFDISGIALMIIAIFIYCKIFNKSFSRNPCRGFSHNRIWAVSRIQICLK